MDDRLILLCGLLLLYVPGAALLLACRVRVLRVIVGAAPAATLGVLQLTALLRWGLGTGLGVTSLAVVAALSLIALLLEIRAGRNAIAVTMARSAWQSLHRAPASIPLASALTVVACWLGISSWLGGFHGLATPPQEHDTVGHTLFTAYIAYTGHAGPFETMPTDLATGGDVGFYPAGAHTFAGILAMVTGNPVSGLNATTALVLGFAAPITLFAAAAGFEPVRTRPVFAGLAALLSVTLYRPSFELAHDAGILAYAMGLALAPSIVVAVAALRRRDIGLPVSTGVAALGLYSVHPSIAVAVVVTLLVAGVVGSVSSSWLRAWGREHFRPLAITSAIALVVTFPWILPTLSAAGAVSSYPEAPPSSPLLSAVRTVALFNYGGFIREAHLYQVGFAVLFWVGFLGCLISRRLWALAAGWLFWAGVTVLFASGHSTLPGVAQLGGVFYNSWTRIDSVTWLLSPLVAALGIAALICRFADVPLLAERRWHRAIVPSSAVVLAIGFLLSFGLGYFRVNERSVAERWGDPEFLRLSPIEPEAFDYLAAHRSEVGRVLNNGNDGSTFLYVYKDIPVVNTYPLGTPAERYGIYLMQHFNEIGTNATVRCLVQRYDITHVLISLSSPRLPTFAAPDHWVKTRWFDYAPGFRGLASVPQVQEVFANPDTTVYRIDPAIVAGHDQSACTADPEHPLPDANAP